MSPSDAWPPLPYAPWRDTCATLHMVSQIVGKVRLARTPLVNHWWNVTLYVSPRGLTTGSMPAAGGAFQIDFDFVEHRLELATSAGARRSLPLEPRPVADVYGQLMGALDELGVPTPIWPLPVEVPDPIRFDHDRVHSAYDPEAAHRFWRALVEIDRVLAAFRARFIGKASPSHFFWGGFDMAATRFSGRLAPPHPGVPGVPDTIVREAYSHECSSAGFWPGSAAFPEAAFYAYAYPEPDGFADAPIAPAAATYHRELKEFVLPYEAVRTAPAPDEALLAFLQTTYEAAADRGGWDRAALERR